MARHIYIHEAKPKNNGKVRDSDPIPFNNSGNTTYFENWGGKLVKGKTYVIGGKKGRVIGISMGGSNGRTPLAQVRWLENSSKDAGIKFITKVDYALPKTEKLGNRSGKIMPKGTVVYKEGSMYRPWFIKNDYRIAIDPQHLVAEDFTKDCSCQHAAKDAQPPMRLEEWKQRIKALNKTVSELSFATHSGETSVVVKGHIAAWWYSETKYDVPKKF